MHYINPYELLEITPENLSDVDSATIKRAKKKLLAEIELSETDTIIHQDIELNKSDCIRAIDDLDSKDKSEFHFFIYQHKHLKRFLTSGKISFFDNYQAESIYKSPEFLDFISQLFSEQYDKILLDNFKKWNQQAVSKILSVKPITNDAFFDKSYKSTHAFIKEIDEEINNIAKEIENKKSPYIVKKFQGLDSAINEKVNVPLLNLLPSYFASVRNQLAKSICDLAIEINNNHKIYEFSFKVIDIANNIETDGLCKQRIIKNYYTLKNNFTEVEQEKENEKQTSTYSETFAKYRGVIKQVDKVIEEVDAGNSDYITKKFKGLPEWVDVSINVSELNSLPEIFGDIRRKIAIQVKHLSVSIWNDYENIEPSFKLIQLASKIKVDAETAAKIKEDFETLKNIDERKKKHGKPIGSTPSMYTLNGIGTKIYEDTLYFTFVFIPIFPIARYSLEYDGYSSYRFFGKLKLHLWQRIWIYALIGGIAYLIISSIIESKQIQTRNQGFRITENGYTESFPLDNSFSALHYSPYLIRRALPINMRTNDVDDIYEDISPDIKAVSTSEIKSIIQLWHGSKVVGEYTDHSDALQNYCFVKIIDLQTKTEIYEDTIFGTLPPQSKSGNSSASGTSADYNLKDFINKLPSERPEGAPDVKSEVETKTQQSGFNTGDTTFTRDLWNMLVYLDKQQYNKGDLNWKEYLSKEKNRKAVYNFCKKSKAKRPYLDSYSSFSKVFFSKFDNSSFQPTDVKETTMKREKNKPINDSQKTGNIKF